MGIIPKPSLAFCVFTGMWHVEDARAVLVQEMEEKKRKEKSRKEKKRKVTLVLYY